MKSQTEDIFEPDIPAAPAGWDVLPFEQTVDVISDKSKRVKQSAYLPSGKLPVIDQGQDFIGGYTDNEDLAFEGGLPVILFGDHTRSIKYVDRPFAVGAEGVKILKPSRGFEPKYLYYLLRSLRIPSRGYSRHFQFLRKFHFPRAPEDQQKRIVAEIEKQFSRLDEAVADLKRVKANLKRYKAAVLKAAVEGRLVETEAEWKQATLGDVLAGIEAGRSFKCEERPPKIDETGVVKVSAVTWGNYNELESKTCKDASRIEERFVIQPADFLFSRANTIELVGACVIARKVTLRMMLSDKILRFRFKPSVNQNWVLYWLRSTYGRSEIERLATGNQNSMRNIGQDRIRQVSINLPQLAEQTRIVAEVERHLSLLHETETQVDTNLQRAVRLRQSVLTNAFSGFLAKRIDRSEIRVAS